MATLSVGHCKISEIIQDAKKGEIKIPQFQRKFVWAIKDCAKLMDSMLKGYPVGSLIFWKTKESLRVVRNVGDFKFPAVPSDDYAFYVLDGQQRITSIIATHMKTHLINDLDAFGVTKDDYNAFFEARVKAIHVEMVARLVKRDNDNFAF